MSLLLERAGFFIIKKNETITKYKLVVVAQQLFTTVKRSNAIAHKAGKRLIESRWAVFFITNSSETKI